MSSMVDKMFNIVVSYKENGYYVYGNIPNKKLEAAFQNYPDIDIDDVILALLDSTVFGSAKTGMIIGAEGIYWNNDWAVKTNRNFLSWEEEELVWCPRGLLEHNRSRTWNGVSPESMKMQPRIPRRCALSG